MSEAIHVFKMEMTCEGCSGAARKVLGKREENKNVDIDMAAQTVTVTSTLSSDELLEILKKTGKTVSYKETK